MRLNFLGFVAINGKKLNLCVDGNYVTECLQLPGSTEATELADIPADDRVPLKAALVDTRASCGTCFDRSSKLLKISKSCVVISSFVVQEGKTGTICVPIKLMPFMESDDSEEIPVIVHILWHNTRCSSVSLRTESHPCWQ